MGRGLPGILLVTLAGATAQAIPPVTVQLTSHNEQPNAPDTPNFTNISAQTDYVRWRNALKEVAEMCVARGLRYSCQNDWNFLEGVRKWEINPLTAVPGITTNTGNKNILQYIYDLGQAAGVPIEIDPHSHEGHGYSYADVAWLINQCSVTAAPVVGGHLWDGLTETALAFDRMASTSGVAATRYTNFPSIAPNWFPELLMGGGSAGHENDPHAAGLWRPASATNYHTHDTNGPLAAIGSWQNDLYAIDRLVERLETNEIPHGGRLWATGLVMNHRDFQDGAYRSNVTRRVLDTLKRWQDEGRIQTTTYMEALGMWQTNYAEASSLYARPPDNVSFSLNWQDFYYTNQSAQHLDALLTLHEDFQVPLDVFFTTWQTDVIEQYPDVMARLQSSAMVAQGYHVRAPKPYANHFQWGAITNPATDKTNLITQYETYGLNLTNGLSTTNPGGFVKLTDLREYPPVCVGALAPANLATHVHNVFSNLGARMLVQHDPPVNVNDLDTYTHLPFRPEHRDWKLIGVWETNTNDPQPTTLSQALSEAHNTATNSGHAPWFVGIKLHDNDLFAEQSQWTLIYSNAASRPWNTSLHSDALPESDQTNRFAFYASLVEEVAARRTNINLMNSFDTVALMGDARARPIGLTRTAVYEEQPAGAELAQLRGGGAIAGERVRYTLVSGDGDNDNADFTVSSNRLLAAATMEYEDQPVRRLRVRWEWVDALDESTVLDSGERALTVVLRDVDTDDDDGDGMTEAEEWIAGTDPLDEDSVLALSSPAGSFDTGAFSVEVYGVGSRTYWLESSTNLADWVLETSGGATNLPGTGAPLSLSDSKAAPACKFYRVVAGP